MHSFSRIMQHYYQLSISTLLGCNYDLIKLWVKMGSNQNDHYNDQKNDAAEGKKYRFR